MKHAHELWMRSATNFNNLVNKRHWKSPDNVDYIYGSFYLEFTFPSWNSDISTFYQTFHQEHCPQRTPATLRWSRELEKGVSLLFLASAINIKANVWKVLLSQQNSSPEVTNCLLSCIARTPAWKNRKKLICIQVADARSCLKSEEIFQQTISGIAFCSTSENKRAFHLLLPQPEHLDFLI